MKGVEKEKSKMFPKLYKTKKRERREGEENDTTEDGDDDMENEDGSLVSE